MLRSVFTLFQNFFDVTSNEIEFIRTKRRRSNNTIVRYTNRPDYLLNMDLEIKGKNEGVAEGINKEAIKKESMEILQISGKGDLKEEKSKVEIGDAKICEKIGDKASFENVEEYSPDGVKSTEVVQKMSRTNLNELLMKSPKMQQKLALKNRVLLDKGKDQLQLLLEQVNKMKTGIHRLQEIAQKFNSTDSFKENVEYLVKNVRPALEKAEVNAKLQPTKKT